MKRSEMFYKAQLAVIRDSSLSAEKKMEILDVLSVERRAELWSEERAEKAAAEAAKDKEEA